MSQSIVLQREWAAMFEAAAKAAAAVHAFSDFRHPVSQFGASRA